MGRWRIVNDDGRTEWEVMDSDEVERRLNVHEQLVKALRDTQELLAQMPGGLDEEADPADESPEDAARHVASLAWKTAALALAEGKERT